MKANKNTNWNYVNGRRVFLLVGCERKYYAFKRNS